MPTPPSTPIDPKLGNPYQFKPGQSGNPGGRLKGLPSFSAALRRQLAKTDRRNRQNLDKIAEKVVAMAIRGDMDAIRWLSDRVDGKVAQNVNVTGEQTLTVVPWLPAVQQAVGQAALTNPVNPVPDVPELVGAEEIEDEEVVEVDE